MRTDLILSRNCRHCHIYIYTYIYIWSQAADGSGPGHHHLPLLPGHQDLLLLPGHQDLLLLPGHHHLPAGHHHHLQKLLLVCLFSWLAALTSSLPALLWVWMSKLVLLGEPR